MKRILGLDLGTTSIGWAYVKEAENEKESSEILKLGVRIIQYDNFSKVDKSGNVTESKNPADDFSAGNGLSPNAKRTKQRGARRNLNRYQLRRENLIEVLNNANIITKKTVLSEEGLKTTFSTYKSRAKAVHEKVDKEELAKIFLMINKKRGYKSSRKTKSEDEGIAIDGMEVAKYLYDNDLTPGQYIYKLLKKDKKYIPDFYRSDLQNEFDLVWNSQKRYYFDILTEELKNKLKDKNKTQTWAICKEPFSIVGIKLKGKLYEQKREKYRLRKVSLVEKISLEQLAIILQEINNQIKQSSGYLGEISDRSKELYFNRLTVGEYLYNQLKKNSHTRLKNQVFYRQDYLDEFERIWEKQKEFHSELTDELKKEIRDVIIFYQRKLKSQKHLISECEFENHHKVIPKSSPLFQEFKIWQTINNLMLTHISSKQIIKNDEIDKELKEILFNELNIREKLTAKEVLKILVEKPNEYNLNFKDGLEGNRTNAELYKAYQNILIFEGEEYDFKKLKSEEINDIIVSKFSDLGIMQELLFFDVNIEGDEFDKQPLLQLWHLIYSFEGDNSHTGDRKLIELITRKFGFKPEYAKIISNIKLQADYGSLSTKAIRKILPFLEAGNRYDIACGYAGYNHSSSFTKEELKNRKLNDFMKLLPKNSLRNPVVEKILNQLANVVNAIIKDENLGKPDEIRIELARELKRNAKERAAMTKNINTANLYHDKIKKELAKLYPFNTGVRITRNDIIKYKLYEELAPLGYHTIYTNTYIPIEKLFSKEFDIEHIIPKAFVFDDSFSNKTLATRDFNSREKSNKTGIDAIIEKYGEESDDYNRYKYNIEKLYNKGKGVITKAKYNKLLMASTEIENGFIERDLRNSQYIAKKAKKLLEEVVRTVNTTTGKITSRLREDWQLISIMQELNWDKYNKLGLTYYEKSKDGKDIPKIVDWTKRNDHRHHAMDALAVAFTRYEHVQYLNNMNARKDKTNKMFHEVYGIEKKYMYRNEKGKLLFKSPIPIREFRMKAKNHLKSILVSFKAKNKVVTRNKNYIIGKEAPQITLTPRGQLHKETIYGRIERYITKEEKISSKFTVEKIGFVAKKIYREALLARLEEFNGDSKKAFTGKNALTKNPIYISFSEEKRIKVPEKVKLVFKEIVYTIRKDITPDLKIDKVIDIGVKRILQERLNEYKGDAKKAFVNLDKNPIWLNKENKISIKRVTITGVSNVEVLHHKKNHNGVYILDKEGNKIPVDYVSTGNNHHIAIYKDAEGNLQDEVVSFFEAVHRINTGLPIINKEKDDLDFLFTMKQNEYFIFPNGDFVPDEIDLLNPDNSYLISPHLFRVQKLSKVSYGNSSVRDYVFRHHLETMIIDKKETRNVTYKVLKSLKVLENVRKVRINHLGQIVKVGE